VCAGVDVNCLPGHAGGARCAQERGEGADFVDGHGAAERCLDGIGFEQLIEVRESLNKPSNELAHC
jgi:hypothetical protein